MNADCQDAIESVEIREICVTILGRLGQPSLPQPSELRHSLFDIRHSKSPRLRVSLVSYLAWPSAWHFCSVLTNQPLNQFNMQVDFFISKARHLGGDNAHIFYRSSQIERIFNNKDKAIAFINKAINLAPDNEECKEFLLLIQKSNNESNLLGSQQMSGGILNQLLSRYDLSLIHIWRCRRRG